MNLWHRYKFYIPDTIYCLREMFTGMFTEKVLRRCRECRRKNGSGHKMDCHREYTKANRQG